MSESYSGVGATQSQGSTTAESIMADINNHSAESGATSATTIVSGSQVDSGTAVDSQGSEATSGNAEVSQTSTPVSDGSQDATSDTATIDAVTSDSNTLDAPATSESDTSDNPVSDAANSGTRLDLPVSDTPDTVIIGGDAGNDDQPSDGVAPDDFDKWTENSLTQMSTVGLSVNLTDGNHEDVTELQAESNKSIQIVRRTDGAIVQAYRKVIVVSSGKVLWVPVFHLVDNSGSMTFLPTKYRSINGGLDVDLVIDEDSLAKLNCFDLGLLRNDYQVAGLVTVSTVLFNKFDTVVEDSTFGHPSYYSLFPSFLKDLGSYTLDVDHAKKDAIALG